MPNARIISDNAAERVTLTATTASGYPASNLLNDDKSLTARSTGTSWTLTGTTATTETAASVHLPFCNLSPTATIRVRLYSDTAGLTLARDTGAILACPAPARKLRGWTDAQAASAYFNGGGARARVWFASTAWRKFVIDISDVSNLQGYIEAARLIVGPYWSPTYNASAAPLATVDSTTLYRNAAGGQMADAGTIHRKMSVDFSMMPPDDRATFANLLLQSRAYPLLISVFPENADASLERDYTIYGRRTENSEVAIAYAGAYGPKIPVEEV